MRNTILVLEQIQKIDLEIIAAEEEERQFNREIERIAGELKKEEEAKAMIAGEVEELNKSIREVETRLSESGEKISKDEKRLNSIKNEKELNAITKEISGANKTKKQSEQEKENLSVKLKDKNAVLEARENALREKGALLEALLKEKEEKQPGWKSVIAGKLQQRDSIKSSIRPDILKKYEAIKAKRSGIGLALVKNETCQGCYIHIPPQVYIQLRRGTEELMFCPHCYRILYAETQGSSQQTEHA